MSFESKYRSEAGADEINKIFKFISGLIIKNNYEANAAATSESVSEYFQYFGAYTKIDSFSDYLPKERKEYKDYVYAYMSNLKNKNYTLSMGVINTLNESRTKSLQDGYDKGLQIYKDYLEALRVARSFNYDEKNSYYRQFMGLPANKSQWLYVPNMEVSEDGYTEVTDFTKEPEEGIEYFTKIDGGYVNIGKLDTWYDPITFDKVADNIYVFNVIPIHQITYESTPNTFNYYIRQKNIDVFIEKYPDYNYLNFVGKGHTAFYLHELPNYSIIQYENGILNSTEYEYFIKSYNKAKQMVVADYIEGFDKRQPLYNLLMIQNLLYFTVINYSNSYIEKYSLGLYTERDLNNILDSHGYYKLSKIKSYDIKYRIVKNLNELIENKGNNYILDLILEKIIQDDNTALKRYFVEKTYNTDEYSQINIDTSRGLENSINLTLREIPATQVEDVITTGDTYVDYDDFVDRDNLWGGVNEDDTEETKLTKKEVLKKQLLSMDFNSILTRYITLLAVVDIIQSQKQVRDMLYLALKYIDITEMKDYFQTKININTTSATPAALFAAMCWLQQMKYYKNPDKIEKNNIVITDCSVFRNFGKLVVDRQSFENTVIYDGSVMNKYDISPDIANWRVAEFIDENPDVFRDFMFSDVETERIESVRIKDTILQPTWVKTGINKYTLTKPLIAKDGFKHLVDETETIEDSIPIYRFYANGIQLGEITADTTFADLLEDYNNQMPNLISRITEKLSLSYDFNTFQAWTYLLNEARKDNTVLFIFKDYDTFSSYISEYCDSPDFLEWLEVQLKSPILKTYKKPSMSDICSVLEMVTDRFKTWINENISYEIYGSDNSTGSDTYIEDMRVLFNEFLSVYSELYSVDFKYTMGDRSTSDFCMCLYYNPLYVHQTLKLQDRLELTHELLSKMLVDLNNKDIDEDTLKLIYDYTTHARQLFNDNINNDLVYDKTTNEYIPEDQFKYDYWTKIASLINDWYGLKDDFNKINLKTQFSDNLNLREILKITTDKGVTYKDEKTN